MSIPSKTSSVISIPRADRVKELLATFDLNIPVNTNFIADIALDAFLAVEDRGGRFTVESEGLFGAVFYTAGAGGAMILENRIGH